MQPAPSPSLIPTQIATMAAMAAAAEATISVATPAPK